MKGYSFLLGLILVLVLSGCSDSPQPGSSSDNNEASPKTEIPSINTSTDTGAGKETSALPIAVDTFTVDELFEAGGGGCGMTLWEPETNPRVDGVIFFHGLGDAMAFMVFDSEISKLSRTAASGEEFYGQQVAQTFITEDGAITVQVNVTQGAPGEIESVSIPDGKITINTQGQTKNILVVGDAGC